MLWASCWKSAAGAGICAPGKHLGPFGSNSHSFEQFLGKTPYQRPFDDALITSGNEAGDVPQGTELSLLYELLDALRARKTKVEQTIADLEKLVERHQANRAIREEVQKRIERR